MCQRKVHQRVGPCQAVPCSPIDPEPVDAEGVVVVVGDVFEFAVIGAVVKEEVILVVSIVVPVTGAHIECEGLQVAVHVENLHKAGGHVGVGKLVQGGQEIDKPRVIVLLFVGLQVVGPAACNRTAFDALVNVLVLAVIDQVGWVGAFVQVAALVGEDPVEPVLVHLFKAGVKSVVGPVDVKPGKGGPALRQPGPFPHVVIELFADHRGIVVLTVEIQLFDPLVPPAGNIFVEADLERLFPGIPRCVAAQTEPRVFDGVAPLPVVEHEAGHEIMVGEHIGHDHVQRIGIDHDVYRRYPPVVKQRLLALQPRKELRKEKQSKQQSVHFEF